MLMAVAVPVEVFHLRLGLPTEWLAEWRLLICNEFLINCNALWVAWPIGISTVFQKPLTVSCTALAAGIWETVKESIFNQGSKSRGRRWYNQPYNDGLVQDCSNSIANALELLQSCTKPSIWYHTSDLVQYNKYRPQLMFKLFIFVYSVICIKCNLLNDPFRLPIL